MIEDQIMQSNIMVWQIWSKRTADRTVKRRFRQGGCVRSCQLCTLRENVVREAQKPVLTMVNDG